MENKDERKSKFEELLEKKIKRYIELEDGKKEVEWEELGKIIDVESDVWELTKGYGNRAKKILVISHTGIEKMGAWIGVDWIENEILDTPRDENDRGYVIRSKCLFPDGSVSSRIASANDKNTVDKKKKYYKNTISNDYKAEMAEKRAMDRAFLRSRYVGFFDVYSAEESNEFNREDEISTEVKKEVEQLKNENEQLKKEKNDMIRMREMVPLISLPSDDEKYPNEKIIDVWTVHEDEEYLQKLSKSDNGAIAWVAKGMIHKIEQRRNEEESK